MNRNKTYFLSILLILITFMLSCEKIAERQKPSVYYIRVLEGFGEVSPAYTTFLETTLKEIQERGNARAVIIEIDTPGGSVKDAEKIVKMLKQIPSPVITYITNSAYSAGALIALAGTYTVMSSHAKAGAMEPVTINPSNQSLKTAPEKIVSAMRAAIKSLAEVRKKRILEDVRLQKRTVENIKWIENLPVTVTAMVDKKIVLNRQEHGIDLSAEKLLTLTAEEAIKTGFSDYSVNSIQEILEKFALLNYPVIEMKPKLKHVFISVLTNPWVMMILLSLGIMGLVIEIKTPGWGIPGTIGVLFLAVFFYTNIVAGNASWEAPVLFIIGLALLLLEIFVIPGFGVVGIVGIILVFLSLYSGLGVQFQNFSGTKHLFSRASAIIFGSIAFAITIVILAFKFLPKTRLFPKIVLTNAELGYRAHEDMQQLIGCMGITVSPLRPSGIAVIDDKRLDVVTEGGYIEKNTKIKVIYVEGSRIVVVKDE